jgi:hypothetical protein
MTACAGDGREDAGVIVGIIAGVIVECAVMGVITAYFSCTY